MVDMILYTKGIDNAIKEEFKQRATPEFLNLMRIGITTYEHAFQYNDQKDKYIKELIRIFDKGRQNYQTNRFRNFIFEKGGLNTLPLIYDNKTANTTIAKFAAEELGHVSDITKDNLIKLLEESWKSGKRQKGYYNFEEEGCILNWQGIILSLGGNLVMFGKEDGYITK